MPAEERTPSYPAPNSPATTHNSKLSHAERGRKGGQTTLARHGRAHYARIGKLGFRAAMTSVGGQVLATILGPSYRQKYGRDPRFTNTSPEHKEAQRLRARTRRKHPDISCIECGQPAHRHHRQGVLNDPDDIEGRCPYHHRRWHREGYRQKRRARKEPREGTGI